MNALIGHLWQSTWFEMAIGLFTFVFRGNRARVRYALWLCASVKFLIPFSVLIDVGSRLPSPSRAPVAVEQVAVTLAEPTTLAAISPRPHAADWRPAALASIWGCGVVAILVIRLRGWRRVQSALRAGAPLALATAVEVRSVPRLLEPGVVGLVASRAAPA